jgi:hypothetical protein
MRRGRTPGHREASSLRPGDAPLPVRPAGVPGRTPGASLEEAELGHSIAPSPAPTSSVGEGESLACSRMQPDLGAGLLMAGRHSLMLTQFLTRRSPALPASAGFV